MNYDLELLDTYKTILSELKDHKELKEYYIAGGAIRDMLLEKPIKDIDIFYLGTLDDALMEATFEVKRRLPAETRTFKLKPKPGGITLLDEFEAEEVATHYGDTTFNVPYQEVYYKDVKLPIQFIKVKDEPVYNFVMRDFGCNLSKVFLHPTGTLMLTQEFILDATLNILTFKSDCNHSYRNKIIAKYPEYSCNGLGSNNSF